MNTITPFTIDIPDEQINDLHTRIRNTRWPESECVDDWSQGIPLAYTKELATYWLNEYNWRTCENKLNGFDQYITSLQGLDIHFIHQRSPHEDAFPLLITHGWPGSIVEFHKIIEPLTNPTKYGGRAEDAFHVICPSLPGYGFSGKPTEAGWGVETIAKAWDELMVRLGYETFGAQGGDWGAAVTTQIGRNKGHCQAIHLNMPIGRPTAEALQDPTDADKHALERLTYYQQWDSGYSKQQMTRPQTIGYGLVDSPVGQMSWIIEKFWSWMDCDGHPENILTKDELPDFQNLNMFLDVNGKRMQTGNTKSMIFNVKSLVSYMSHCMTLYPGDICCTGTPPGVGENMKPPIFLKGGEHVKLGIDKLGEQNHKVKSFK